MRWIYEEQRQESDAGLYEIGFSHSEQSKNVTGQTSNAINNKLISRPVYAFRRANASKELNTMRTFYNLFLNFRQKGKANNMTRYIHTLRCSSEEQKHTRNGSMATGT